MTKTEIIHFLTINKEYMHDNFGVEKIGLFGSFSRDEAKPESDIDIAVEISSNNSFRSFFSLKYYLENAFNQAVDLGIESSLKPLAKDSILKDIIYV